MVSSIRANPFIETQTQRITTKDYKQATRNHHHGIFPYDWENTLKYVPRAVLCMLPSDWEGALKRIPRAILRRISASQMREQPKEPGFSRVGYQWKNEASAFEKDNPQKSYSNEVKIGFLGDLMPESKILKFSDSFEKRLQIYDYIVVNFESTAVKTKRSLRLKDSHGFAFQTETKPLVDLFERMGVHKDKVILKIANNHSNDFSDVGDNVPLATKTNLEAAGFRVVGHCVDPEIIETPGKPTFALRNFTSVGNGGRMQNIATAREAIGKDLDAFKKEHEVSAVIDSAHMNVEFRKEPTWAGQVIAHATAENGVDARVDDGPHLAYAPEIYTTSNGRKVPIARSIGDMISRVKIRNGQFGALAELIVAPEGVKEMNVLALSFENDVLDVLDENFKKV